MKNSSKRTIARVVAFVMLVSTMFTNMMFVNADPADLLVDEVISGEAVAVADAQTYKFEASTLSAAADKEALTQSEVDSYFTISGNIVKRTSGDAVKSVELDKAGKSSISFTTTADSSSVVFYFSSTGTSNDSQYAMTNAAGTVIAEGTVTGSGNGEAISAENLPADTYSITNTSTGRGGRVYSITVVENGDVGPVEPPTEETTEATTEAVEDATTEVTTTGGAIEEPGEKVASNFEFWLDDVAVDVAGDDGTVVKTVEPGEYKFDDSVITLVGQADNKYTPSYAAAVGITRAGKTVNGYKAGNRHATANDIPSVPQAGDGTAIVFTPAATGTFTAYICSTSFLRVWDFDAVTGERYGYTDSDVDPEFVAFKAEAGHTYVLSTTGKTNNMAYCGFEYIVDEPVTVAVSENNVDANPDSLATLEVYLTDAALGTKEATVKSDTTSVDLAKGHTYILSTNDGGVRATVNGSDRVKIDGSAIVIDLFDIPDVTLTGEITGATAGVTGLKFVNMLSGVEYVATIDGTSYSAVMKPGEYNTVVTTTDGSKTYDRVSVKETGENVNEVYVEAAKAATGTFTPNEIVEKFACSAGVASRGNDLTAKPGDTIVIPIDGEAVVTVSAYYEANFDIDGMACEVTSKSTSQIDTFTVNATGDVTITFGGSATSYLTAIEITPVVSFKDTINVPGDYDTLGAAVAAIKGMSGRPEGEDGRVTINLTADVQEQVVFDAPYITLNGNDHTLSWYYGVGTKYYSIDPSTGLYSERLFRDKYTSAEGDGQLWGGVAIIRGDYFRAENTTFKNTYNYEIVAKELEDVESTLGGIPMRTADTDVTKYASKERSNAFLTQAKNIEIYNCQILSSQDTFGANGTNLSDGKPIYGPIYVKDSVIGGNTDYICGEFAVVFDNCELQWKTFKDDPANNAKVGYITAPKTSPYVFRNCTITTSGDEGSDPVLGYFGRTWGDNSYAAFINTETNGHINAAGWGEMSAGQYASAKFIEYNNTVDGYMHDITSMATVPTREEAKEAVADFIDDAVSTAIDTVLGGWEPVHYAFDEFQESTETTEATTAAPADIPAGKDAWYGIDDEKVVPDANINGGVTMFTSDRFTLKTGDGGVTCGEDWQLDLTTGQNVLKHKWVKDTSTDAAGRVTVDASALGGGAAAKVRVALVAETNVDGTMTVDLKLNEGKEAVIFDQDGNVVYYFKADETLDPLTITIPVEAGNKYSIGAVGSSPWIYDVIVSNEIEEGTDAWVGLDDENVVADGKINGAVEIFDSPRLNLVTGDGGVACGEDWQLDLTTGQNVLKHKWVKDTSTDAAGRVTVDASALGGGAAAKVRVALVATAKVDGTLSVDLKLNEGKEAVIFDQDGNVVYYFKADETLDPLTITIPAEAGKKYSIGAVGSSPWIYSVAVSNETEESTETTTETSTEATTVETSTETTTSTPVTPPTPDDFVWGDANGNTVVEAADAALVIQYVLNPANVTILTDRVDVNADGLINSEDAAMILQKSLDSTYKFPVEPDELDPTTVYIVGDSTGCHYPDTEDAYYWYKRVGFGDKVADYLNENATVVNLALSGRSSKSFATGINENALVDQAAVENYAQLKNNIKEGDYLIIAWGHNDEKTDEYRYTDPNLGIEDPTSFKYSLYNNYIKVALDAGATPILVTPIIRANTMALSANDKHQPAAGDYGQTIRDLGAELGVTVIDQLNNTQKLFAEMTNPLNQNAGPSVAEDGTHVDPVGYYKLHAALQDRSVDTTHLNGYGASYVAYMLAKDIKASDNTLSAYVKDDIAAPEFNDAEIYNTDWVAFDESEYIPSSIWKVAAPWAGSAFGSGIGTITEDSHDNFDIVANADGSVKLHVANNKGKIASAEDGIVMYFQEIDANQDFTLTATAHVDTYDATNNQSAFGLMLRDNMFADYTYKTNRPYIAVGNTSQNSGKEKVQVWGRTVAEAGTGNLSKLVIANNEKDADNNLLNPAGKDDFLGQDINLKISRKAGVVTVQYGDEAPYEVAADFTDLSVCNAAKDYVGLFVSRAATVTFSNINYNNSAE